MKTRLFFAALLLLAFGTVKAQVNEPKTIDPKTDSIMKSRMAEIKQAQEQFSERMRELGMNRIQLIGRLLNKTWSNGAQKWKNGAARWSNGVQSLRKSMICRTTIVLLKKTIPQFASFE